MAQSQGRNLGLLLRFVARLRGEDGKDELLSRLDARARNTLAALDEDAWYPLDLHYRLLAAVDDDEGMTVRAWARHKAELDLNKVEQLVLQLRNPAHILERLEDDWEKQFDGGVWMVERTEQGGGRCVLSGLGEVHPVFCVYLSDYIARTLELVGATEVTVDHPICQAERGAECVFDAYWRV